MAEIRLDDVTKIYPFQEVGGLFNRKKKQEILKRQQSMPYTSNEGVIALQHFSAVFKDGEFAAILGPSGSGKTTLLRILAGLERATLGTVSYDGKDINEIDLEDRDIAMVFQNFSLYPNQTVYKNIAFPLEVRHMPREEIEPKVKKIAKMLGLENKLDKLPDDLSGGEKQRVAIGRALIKEPSVLLLDEPFANLDVPIKRRLRQELKKVHEAFHTTFIYVTHDQYDALALADHVIVLKDGIKQMDDTTANIYNAPANRFTAEFVGSPSMNIFEDVEVNKDGDIILFGKVFPLKRKLHKKKRVDVGIRGTNIRIVDKGIGACIDHVEMIEADLHIHVAVGDQKLLLIEKAGEATESKYLRGQEVDIELDKEHFHLFDEEGRRI
ncbi:MAG: ABC transporter ATP-binding protein [Erysipelotrichaceae bacterium]|nr:ABC transporter ATP-binding protein [Erysipelotrichaceae bacterium]